MTAIEVKKYNPQGRELAIRFGLGGVKAVGIGMVSEMVKNRNNNGAFKDIYDFAERSGSKIVNKKSLEALSKSGAFDSIHDNRNQIVESVEILCKYASIKEDERNSNQMSLFGAAKIIDKKPILNKSEQWDKKRKLQEEFKAFGFFVREHPINDFLDSLKRRGVIFSENLEDLSDGNIVKLAGVVAYSKHKSGPKGRYAYLTLSDPFGIYETAIFDEELITKSRDVLVDGDSIALECMVKKDQGGLRILVRSIFTLDDFIKNNVPKKEYYQNIKQQGRSSKGDWKKRLKESKQDSQQDSLVEAMNYKKKIDILREKKILKQIEIKIHNRQDILNIKSFLSQKISPDEFTEFTQVNLLVENESESIVKIKLNDKYLLDERDYKQLCDR